MTIAEIKQKLPQVKVKINNTIVTASVSGRQLDFPIVHTNYLGVNLQWEFSWYAIQNAVNNNKVLIV